MHFLLSWVCNFFKQIYIINFKLRSNLLLLKKSFFSIQKCRGWNVNIITNHFFKKMGNKKEEDLSSISKMIFMCSECYIIIYEVSEYISIKFFSRASNYGLWWPHLTYLSAISWNPFVLVYYIQTALRKLKLISFVILCYACIDVCTAISWLKLINPLSLMPAKKEKVLFCGN